MYKSIDHALYQSFRIKATLIMDKSNAATIAEWIKSKGVVDRSRSGLSQHDWHANSAMILSRAKEVLNNIEWSLINAMYGYDLSGIVDLTSYILSKTDDLTILECDALLEHLFLRKIKQPDIQDRFDWSKGKLHRKLTKVKRVVNQIHNECIIKLETDMGSIVSKN
jgi:hypothetical protein